MDQKTKDWHEWRGKGIGSSDAPIIMGVSPYKTPYQLWETKIGVKQPTDDDGNWATRRGNELEPVARSMYELETGLEMPATLAYNEKYPFLRASLDGWNAETQTLLEIKCPGRDDHATAMSGKIPEKYIPQVQHQLFVTGAKEAHYYSFKDGKGVLVRARADMDYIELLVRKEIEFWCEFVEKEVPPPFTDRDRIVVEDLGLIALSEQYCELQAQIKEIEKRADEVKKLLSANPTHPRMIIGRVSVDRVVRRGSIDYKRVPELGGVDVEKYRKESTTFYTVKELKK